MREGISFGSLAEARGHASLIRREMFQRAKEKLNDKRQKKIVSSNDSKSSKDGKSSKDSVDSKENKDNKDNNAQQGGKSS